MLLLLFGRADGVAWVRAALVRDLVCPTCSSFSCWVAPTLLCMRKRWSSSTPTPSSHSSSPCHTAPPSWVPMPLCMTAVPLRSKLWDRNNLSLACQSAFCWLPPLPRRSTRSAFACWFRRLPCCSAVVAACFPEFPLGSNRCWGWGCYCWGWG